MGAAADAAGATSHALGRLFAVAEAYPQLRASENFQRLQEELTDTEDKIAAARRYYNTVVQRFNTAQQTFPLEPGGGDVRLRAARVLPHRGRRRPGAGRGQPVT